MITFIQTFNNSQHGSIVSGILDDFVAIMYFTIPHIVSSGKCDGRLPSELVPRSSSLGSMPAQKHCVMFLVKMLYSQCLSTLPQLYVLASHPGGRRSTPSPKSLHVKETRISSGLIWPLGSYAEVTFIWSVVINDCYT